MISQNILLVSIVLLLSSLIIQEYQDELIDNINGYIPNLFSTEVENESSSGSQSQTLQINPKDLADHESAEAAVSLLKSYESILTGTKVQDMKCIPNKDLQNQSKFKNCYIAFGYVADLDIYVDGLELMQNLGINSDIQAVFHEKLSTITEVGETFSLFFDRGAGGEFRVESKSVFDEIVKHAKLIFKKKSLGGNASTMAARAFKEQTQVILAHAMNEEYYSSIFNNSAILLENPKEINDIHLVLDFYKDSPWGNARYTPRSNRLYLHNDIENTKLIYKQKLNDYLMKNQSANLNLDVVALGGFQLLSHIPEELITETMESLRNEIINLKKFGAKIHLEMGTFTDPYLFAQLVSKPLLHVDSIGLNEQELANILYFLEKQSVIEAADSQLGLNDAIREVVKLLSYFHKFQFAMNRVHFHTINMQMICSKEADWESSRLALVKAIVVAIQESEDKDNNYFDFPENKLKINVPREIILSMLNDEFELDEEVKVVEFDLDNPVNCWNPHSSMQCCIAPTIRVRHPAKTCGLGDNISATGLVYHKVKKEV